MSNDDLSVTVIVEEDVIVEEGDDGGGGGSPVMIPIGLRQVASPIGDGEEEVTPNSYLVGAVSSSTLPTCSSSTNAQFNVPVSTEMYLDIGIYYSNGNSTGWSYTITASGVTPSRTTATPADTTPVSFTTPATTGSVCSVTVKCTESNVTYTGNMCFST